MTTQALEDVLSFWFDPANRERWFERDPALDAEIARRFAPLVEDAAAGRLDALAGEPRGALALCVLLDQFPRNIWRGTKRAFACNGAARRVADQAVAAGLDRGLPPEQRLFLYLPFEHSESLADQERSVALCHSLHAADDTLAYARDHADIIHRFGRFPHRNPALGRHSSPAERAFLEGGGFSG